MNKQRITYDEYSQLVSKICRDIAISGWYPDYIVGITRGGLLPGVMLSHYFNIPLHTLNVSLRDNSDMGPESNLWIAEDAFGYDTNPETSIKSNATLKKKILIVDDINDSGATLNWIMQDWRSGCLPGHNDWDYIWNNNVKFAVIVDNLASKCNVKMDYVGIEVNKKEKDVWIEFPYEDWWTK